MVSLIITEPEPAFFLFYGAKDWGEGSGGGGVENQTRKGVRVENNRRKAVRVESEKRNGVRVES